MIHCMLHIVSQSRRLRCTLPGGKGPFHNPAGHNVASHSVLGYHAEHAGSIETRTVRVDGKG